eukprot:6460493-Amphidinium_carterae.2
MHTTVPGPTKLPQWKSRHWPMFRGMGLLFSASIDNKNDAPHSSGSVHKRVLMEVPEEAENAIEYLYLHFKTYLCVPLL